MSTVRVRGIERSNLDWVERMRPSKAAHSARYLKVIGNNQAATVAATDLMLGKRTFPGRDVYAEELDARYPSSLGETGWMDVLKTFTTGIASGVSAKIGGHAPAAQTIINPPAPSIPTWAKVAIVGGVGVGVLLLMRR